MAGKEWSDEDTAEAIRIRMGVTTLTDWQIQCIVSHYRRGGVSYTRTGSIIDRIGPVGIKKLIKIKKEDNGSNS